MSDSRFSTRERARAGYIITARNMDDGTERVFHRGGFDYEENSKKVKFTARAILESMCDVIESWGPDWRITCISSPETVYSDLRMRERNPIPNYDNEAVALAPEIPLLNAIGRIHLWWKPSLYRTSRAA